MTRDILDAIPAGTKSVIVDRRADSRASRRTARTSAARSLRVGGARDPRQRAQRAAALYDGMNVQQRPGPRRQLHRASRTNDATVRKSAYETGGLVGGKRGERRPHQHHPEGRRQHASAASSSARSRTTTCRATISRPDLKARGLTSVDRSTTSTTSDPAARRADQEGQLWFYRSCRQWKTNTFAAGIFYNLSPVPQRTRRTRAGRPSRAIATEREPAPDVAGLAEEQDHASASEAEQQRDHFYSQSTTNRTQAPDSDINYHGAAVVSVAGELERAGDQQAAVRGRRGFANKDFQTSCSRRAHAGHRRRSRISAPASAGATSATRTATTPGTTSTRALPRPTSPGRTPRKSASRSCTSGRGPRRTVTNNGVTYSCATACRAQITLFATPLVALRDAPRRTGRLRPGSVDAQAADAQRGRALRLLQQLRAGPDHRPRTARARRERHVSRGRRRAELEERDAAARRRLRPVRQRQDGRQGQHRQVPRSAEPDDASRGWRIRPPTSLQRDADVDRPQQRLRARSATSPTSTSTANAAASANVNFGNSIPTTVVRPDGAHDARVQLGVPGRRPARAAAAGFRVAPSTSRRWFGNLRGNAQHRRDLGELRSYCVTAPLDAGLPGGGGYSAVRSLGT